MKQNVSPQVAIAIVAIILIVAIALGTLWYRNSSGVAAADAMHATMKKIPPGHGPFTPEQMDQARKMLGRKANGQ
ncbi:MAG TPA: hypothetical protein VKT32_07135 [Chthonomonadaceae bacterium]|nr:hypothetical protein [Chthonomonadaceae bacterium]